MKHGTALNRPTTREIARQKVNSGVPRELDVRASGQPRLDSIFLSTARKHALIHVMSRVQLSRAPIFPRRSGGRTKNRGETTRARGPHSTLFENQRLPRSASLAPSPSMFSIKPRGQLEIDSQVSAASRRVRARVRQTRAALSFLRGIFETIDLLHAYPSPDRRVRVPREWKN